MFESFLQNLLPVIIAAGPIALITVYYLEGAILGKLVQPSFLFVGYLTAVSPRFPRLTALVTACIIAATAGQWTIYRGFNDDVSSIVETPTRFSPFETLISKLKSRISPDQIARIEYHFSRHEALTIIICNLLPGIRNLVTIPAALNSYPQKKFILASAIANTIELTALTAIAYGLRQIISLLL